MNINIPSVDKFWKDLQRLFKPKREVMLVSRNQETVPAYSVAKNVLKNNIAQVTNVNLVSQHSFGECSTVLRETFEIRSGLVRQSFGSCSTAVRQVVEAQSKRSRTAPEQDSKPSRTNLEAESNSIRSGVEQDSKEFKSGASGLPKYCTVGTSSLPSFNPLRTLFYRRSLLHRMCTALAPYMLREKGGATAVQVRCKYEETCKRVKTRLKESPNKVRIAIMSFLLNFIKNILTQIFLDVRLVYWGFTKALLKRYQKGTENVLESYQRATEDGSLAVLALSSARQVREYGCQCVAQASVMRMLSVCKAWIVRKTVPVYALSTQYIRLISASSILNHYTESALSEIRGFKRSNFFCQVS